MVTQVSLPSVIAFLSNNSDPHGVSGVRSGPGVTELKLSDAAPRNSLRSRSRVSGDDQRRGPGKGETRVMRAGPRIRETITSVTMQEM